VSAFEVLQAEIEPAAPIAASALLLNRIRGGNAYEETVERLLQTIRLGLINPGEQLPPERELASMLNVSRDTVRDATSSLADAGYLVIRRGRYGGTFIAEVLPVTSVIIGRDGELLNRHEYTKDEILDALTFRAVLESGAAYQAAATALTEESRAALVEANLETKQASPEDYRRLDSRLHLLIAQLTGSATLVNQIAESRMKVNGLLNEFPLLTPNVAHSNEQHEAIVMAILSGDSERASAEMLAHLEGSASLIKGFLA
jgi:DNA-binding FadR family transcriptional regulator